MNILYCPFNGVSFGVFVGALSVESLKCHFILELVNQPSRKLILDDFESDSQTEVGSSMHFNHLTQ